MTISFAASTGVHHARESLAVPLSALHFAGPEQPDQLPLVEQPGSLQTHLGVDTPRDRDVCQVQLTDLG